MQDGHNEAGRQCQDGQCFIGYVDDYADSGMFNHNDVFMLDSQFPERVRSGNEGDGLRILVFSFCPQCGTAVDRQKVAGSLGLSLEKCGPC